MSTLEFEGAPIVVSPEFGSANPGHRELIRERLQHFVTDSIRRTGRAVSTSEGKTISTWSDLKNRPSLDGWGISISHCPALGGFIASPNSQCFGFDVEITTRVSMKAAKRVAVFPGEEKYLQALLERSLPVAMFWVAKEAAIKSFGNSTPDSPTHFGEVEIIDFDLAAQKFTGRRDGHIANGQLFFPPAFSDLSTAGAVAKL